MADALFDTTVFIDYHNGDLPAASIVQPVLDGDATAAYSPVSTFEIWLGLAGHREETVFKALFQVMEEAQLNSDAASLAATWLRGTSPRRAGATFRDALIAATAEIRGEVIVTRNLRDFERFGVRVQPY